MPQDHRCPWICAPSGFSHGLLAEGFVKSTGPYKETTLFTQAIQHANRLKPDFVIICGDLTQNGGRIPEELQALHKVKLLLDESIPLYLVSGNTDVGRSPSSKTLDAYRNVFGKDWYAFQHKDTYNIVLNTAVICNAKKDTPTLKDQRKWLEGALQASGRQKPTHIFIYQHHPIIKHNLNEPDNYTNLPIDARKDYLDLFLKHNVRAVFAGHLHRNIVSKYESIELITSGPITKPSGKDKSGIRIVKVFKDHIKHTYYALDEVPDRITLDE